MIGSAAANSSVAASAGWFTTAGATGISGAAAFGIGAVVTVAIGSIVVGVQAAWSRETAKKEFSKVVLDKLRENKDIRDNCEIAA